MKNSKLLIASLLSIVALSSCGNGASSSLSSPLSTSPSDVISGETPSSTSSSSSTSSTSEEETYNVVIRAVNGATITTDKDKAKRGETVTITVIVSSGYSLSAVKVNSDASLVTQLNDTSFVFIMPEGAAVISVDLNVLGDVTISGAVAVSLAKDEATGVYSARDVEMLESGYVSFYVEGKKLSSLDLNYHKCNADIENGFTSSTSEESLRLAGNAKYDFFYDPSDPLPCYIRRSEVINAPSAVNHLESLFSGSVRSENTHYPADLKKVEFTRNDYKESTKNDSYTWTNYATGSLGVSQVNGKTFYDYRNINGSTYEVVDTYIEAGKDGTRGDDRYAYSAKYDLVSEIESGHRLYQRTLHETDSYGVEAVEWAAHHNSHDVESLDFDIHYGYRTGFDMEWDPALVDASVEVSSQRHNDGSFTTTVESFKNYDNSKDTGTTETDSYRYEYHMELKFRKDGSPLSGTYVETFYSSDAYDVNKGEFKQGGADMGSVVKEVSYTYSYGEAEQDAIPFDKTPYFINEITSATVRNENAASSEGNIIEQNDQMISNRTTGVVDETSSHLKLTFTPSTALDEWQYGITASSNEDVIKSNVAKGEPYTFIAVGEGTSTLTISNHTKNSGVTKTVDVSVENAYLIDGFYLQGYDPNNPSNQNYYDEEVLANKINVRAGCTKSAFLYLTSRNTGKYVKGFKADITLKSSNTELITASFDKDTSVVTFDALKARVTENTTVTFKIDSPKLETGVDAYGDPYKKSLQLTVCIMPYNLPSQPLYGEWSDASDQPSSPLVLILREYVEGDNSTYSTLSADGKTYRVKFKYDASSGKITTSSPDLDFIEIVYDDNKDEIGVCAIGQGSWTGQDTGSYGEVICGSAIDDDEGYYIVDKYYFLSRVA